MVDWNVGCNTVRSDLFRRSTGQIVVWSDGAWEAAGACFCIPAGRSGARDLSFFVTAFHVVKESFAWKRPVRVEIGPRGTQLDGTIVATDRATDLAIVQVSGIYQSIPCAIDIDGGPVALIGYPHAFKRQELTHAEWRGAIINSGEAEEHVVISLYCEE